MNTQICKWFVSFAIFFCLIIFTSTVIAVKPPGKPDKPGKPPPDPIVEPNHALAINGYGKGLDIYAVDVDGSNPVRIVRPKSGFTWATVWSPDGTRIVWSDTYYKNLQMVNVDGSNRQEILASTDEMTLGIVPTPSGFDCSVNDDGVSQPQPANLLYFLGMIWTYGERHEDFYVLDLDNLSTPIRLTNKPLERHSTLEVSPDGQFIATWTYDAPEGNWDDPDARLEIRDACGSGLPVIKSWAAEDLELPNGNLYFERIDWSSKNILAVSGFSDGPDSGDITEDIYLIDLGYPVIHLDAPVKVEKLIGAGEDFGDGVNNRRATWSPDGTLLAFTSDHDVYILDTESGAFTQIASFKMNRDIDWRPTWKAEP
jgi:WD40 repeat protein